MLKPLINLKGYKKITNLKFLQLNIPKFKELKFPDTPFFTKLSGLKSTIFYPPLYVLFFSLMASAVVLGVTSFWQNNLAPVAYKTDNLETAPAETNVIFVDTTGTGEQADTSAQPEVQAKGQAQEVPSAASGPAQAETVEPDLNSMLRPIEGQVEQGLAFTYSQVHDDYRLHPGVDITAQRGSQVRSSLAGTVEEVVKLPEGGYQVTVSHGAGWQTVYSAVETGLEPGDILDQGTNLGRLTGKVPGETEQGSHLHFELRRNGEAIDPATYIDF